MVRRVAVLLAIEIKIHIKTTSFVDKRGRKQEYPCCKDLRYLYHYIIESVTETRVKD